ncbi:MAG TPA: diacylglycerol kinase family protein [Dehalococcoidia bacterium]|nr:diacylglycerol kinase family protein [Dehalococcoidia bacterium]
MDKATIVYNPAARNAPNAERLRFAAAALLTNGWEIDVVETSAAEHATKLAREAAAAGASVVFACGGDGTVNEVVNGLVGSEAALGVVRGGMGDVFGKEIDVPRDPNKALRVLIEGTRRRFDLGRANDRYFMMMCGIGFDAAVVRGVPDNAKRRMGSFSYIIWGLREALRWRPKQTTLSVDHIESELQLHWAILGNTRSYGGVLNVASQALVDDGLLDAYIFDGKGPVDLAVAVTRVALRRREGGRLSFRRLRELEVQTAGLMVQADGEYVGETPMRFEAVAGALDVMLPPGGGERLFSSPESRVQGQASDMAISH